MRLKKSCFPVVRKHLLQFLLFKVLGRKCVAKAYQTIGLFSAVSDIFEKLVQKRLRPVRVPSLVEVLLEPPFINGEEFEFPKFSKKGGGGSDFSHKNGGFGKIGGVSLIFILFFL